jgi:hypothetical protein
MRSTASPAAVDEQVYVFGFAAVGMDFGMRVSQLL